MTPARTAGAIAAALVAVLASRPAAAHEFRPGVLHLDEVDTGSFDVAFAIRADGVDVVLPAHCERVGPGSETRWRIDCGAAGLAGHAVAVRGLAEQSVETTVLARVTWRDGRTATAVLETGAARFEVPAPGEAPAAAAVARTYARLGVEHIVFGADHLVFVAVLLFLVRGRRRLIATLTGFTVGHSVTLGLAATGALAVPSRPVEALIALSIALVAAELVARELGHRDGREDRSLLARKPWLVAGAFGLLHGFGFAGALADVGLPAGEVPLALAAFNAGVEIGQIAVALGLAVIVYLLRRAAPAAARPATVACAYAAGGVAALWTVQRAVEVIS